jgi:hypothetical protein
MINEHVYFKLIHLGKASKQNVFKAIVVKPQKGLVDTGIIRTVSNSHSMADGF